MNRSASLRKTLAALLLGSALVAPGLRLAAGAHAASTGFAAALLGSWHNANPAGANLTRLQFFAGAGGRLYLHAYGKCQPSDCDLGVTTVAFPPAQPARAVYVFSFAIKTISIVKQGVYVTTDTATHFTDGSGRRDYHTVEDFLADR